MGILFTNAAQLHLLINHLPVLLPIVAIAVTATGGITGLRQTRNVGLVLLLIGAVSAIPTYLTGGPARSVVQNYPLITVASIERHQQFAFYALGALETVGLMSLVILIFDWRRKPITRSALFGLVAMALLAIALVVQTAHSGGLIRHEELTLGRF